MIVLLFDYLLVALLAWLGWHAVTDADPLHAVVHFIVLGLLLSMAWVRLGAPDVALAEAAVGSGLTGALLLVACRRLLDRRDRSDRPAEERQP